MPDPFRKLQPGDGIPTSATLWNAMIEAGRQAAGSRFDRGRSPLTTARSSALIRVENTTESDLDRFAVLGLDDPIFQPHENEDAFLREVTFKGVEPSVPTHSGRFAILFEPSQPGTVVRAWVAGCTQVRLDVLDDGHEWADVEDGITARLQSSTVGSAQIVWREGTGGGYDGYGTGEQWAIVRIGCRPGDVGIGQVTVQIGKASGATRPGVGKVKLYTTVDMGTSPPTYGGLTSDEYDCLSFNLDKKIKVGAVVPLNRILGQWHAVNVNSCTNLES